MKPLRVLATSIYLALFASGAAGACTISPKTRNERVTATGGAGGSGGATSLSSSSGAGATRTGGNGGATTTGGDDLFDGSPGGDAAGGGRGCAAETQFVYALAANNTLYKFDPLTLTFTSIGELDCPAHLGSPFSMAVDRDARAWVVFTKGALAQVDTKNGHCSPTSFVAGQSGFTTFGMGFSSNSPGSADETLFVSESSFSGTTLGLATIDLQTLKLTPIGMYDSVHARAELTGTGDARLFAAFEGTPYTVTEIAKTDAKILSQAPQAAVSSAPGASNFAFAFWGGDFWLFVGPGTSTDVFRYKPTTGLTTMVTSFSAVIVGAGVSTCAPTKPPS